MLPAGVLGTQCLGEVFLFADRILTEKEQLNAKIYFKFFMNYLSTNLMLIVITMNPVQVRKEHRKHKEPPSSVGTS